METKIADMGAIGSSNIVEIVHRMLTEAIVSGAIRPGERIVEAEMARRLNISRGPLREAARRLEQQGLLESRPRRGFFVKEFGPEEIDHLYEMRICLQVEAARLAAARMTAEDFDEMQRRFNAVAESSARGDPAGEILDAGLFFHRLVFELTGNDRFVKAFDSLALDTRQVVTVLNSYEQSVTGRTDTFYLEYLPLIVRAFEHRDADLAASATRVYLEKAKDSHATMFQRMRADHAAGLKPS